MVAALVEAEVAGRRRERRDRDGDLLEGASKELRRPDASKIQTEVFLLPAANFAEKDGTFPNSARWLQWKWKALDPPGQAKPDQEIIARIFLAVRDLYKKEGGALPEPVLNVSWAYTNPSLPTSSEVLQGDQRQGARRHPGPEGQDQDRSRPPASSSTASASSATTARRCAATGSTRASSPRPATTPSAGQPPIRRASGMFHNWAFTWPANRRVMYNRASADARRQALGLRSAPGIAVERREVGRRRPRHQARLAARASSARSSCCPRASARLFAPVAERRPVPRALRADRGAGRRTRSTRRSSVEPGRRSGSPPTRTSTARADRVSRSSARPTG